MSLPKNPLLAEATVNLIISQIQAQFNALIADVDNQYSDGIRLEPLSNESIYISYDFQTLKPPSVHVLLDEHAFQYTKDPNYMESADKVVVVVHGEDMGKDVLTRKMWRYARVIYGCLNLIDLQTSDGRLKIKCVAQRIGYTAPGPVSQKLAKTTSKFTADCVLDLRVLHYENFLT